MLSGNDLVRFVKSHPDLTESEQARQAGYTRTTPEGKEQLLLKAFNKALLEANGITFARAGHRGKTAGFETTVHKNGNLMVGKAYTQRFGLDAGTRVQIVLDEDEIRLVPITA